MKNCLEKLQDYQIKLRKKLTIKEIIVFRILKKRNLRKKKFCLPQYIIPPYIVDFYIPTRGLIIEIDGGVHNTNLQKEKDYKREDYLMSMGLMVQRFINTDSEEYISKKIDSYPKIDDIRRNRIESKISTLKYISTRFNLMKQKFNSYEEMIKFYTLYFSKLANNPEIRPLSERKRG